MPKQTSNADHLTWAQAVFQAFGWTYEEIETAEASYEKLQAIERKKAEREATLAAAFENLQDSLSFDTSEKDLNELKADFFGGGVSIEKADPQIAKLLDTQIKRARVALTAEKEGVGAMEDGEEKMALLRSVAIVDRLLAKAEAEGKLGRQEAAQTTLADAEAKTEDIRKAHLALKASDEEPLLENADALAAAVEKGAAALRSAGFDGPASRLTVQCAALIETRCASTKPAWKPLNEDVDVAVKSAGEFKKLSGFIEKNCISLGHKGLQQIADGLRAELEKIRTGTAKRVLTSLTNLVALKIKAAEADKQANADQWTEAHLVERTEKLRDALKTLFRTEDSEVPLEREDKSQAEKRAEEYPGLAHDVYVKIPRRKDKKIPRATMEALLDAVNTLDGLKDAGVKGIEDIAAEELLKAEDLLAGIQNQTGEYDQIKRDLPKLAEKVADLGGDTFKKQFYIEERQRLSEDIESLKESYLTQNIIKSLQELNDLDADRYKPLKEKICLAAAKKKQFDKLASKAEDLFCKIADVMKGLGFADCHQDVKGKSNAVIFSELCSEARKLAENAQTKEELDDAIARITQVLSNAKKQFTNLKDYAEELKFSNESSDVKKAFFDQLAADYKLGLDRVQKQEKDARNFENALKPLTQEMAALQRKLLDPRRLVDKKRGFEREDVDTYNKTRLAELKAELEELKQDCDANSSHAENTGKVLAAKEKLSSIRGDITGFREDVAKDLKSFYETCSTRLKDAADYIQNKFFDAVAAKQGDDQAVLAAAALKKFLAAAAAPLSLNGLEAQVAVISDKNAEIPARKAAREKALRQVRPLLAELNGNKAIQHYMKHPFDDLPNGLGLARRELTQLEVKLLQLAS